MCRALCKNGNVCRSKERGPYCSRHRKPYLWLKTYLACPDILKRAIRSHHTVTHRLWHARADWEDDDDWFLTVPSTVRQKRERFIERAKASLSLGTPPTNDDKVYMVYPSVTLNGYMDASFYFCQYVALHTRFYLSVSYDDTTRAFTTWSQFVQNDRYLDVPPPEPLMSLHDLLSSWAERIYPGRSSP